MGKTDDAEDAVGAAAKGEDEVVEDFAGDIDFCFDYSHTDSFDQGL